jgi:hypothetical protein
MLAWGEFAAERRAEDDTVFGNDGTWHGRYLAGLVDAAAGMLHRERHAFALKSLGRSRWSGRHEGTCDVPRIKARRAGLTDGFQLQRNE